MTLSPRRLARRSSLRIGAHARYAVLLPLAAVLWMRGGDAGAQTVNQAAAGLRACNASPIAGLSNQIFDTLMCQHPGALVPIEPGHGVNRSGGAYSPVRMYVRPDALDRLYQFAAYGAISVTDTYRTLADQYLFGHAAAAARCGGPLAPPGTGRHETGVALDVNNAGGVASNHPASLCCRPLVSFDPVHFECRPGCRVGSAPSAPGDLQVRSWDVQAFKHLWNVNHPGDPLDEGSAAVDAATLSRLGNSPAGGFPSGGCAPDRDGDGYSADVDCNDNDPLIHPGAPERCNNVDDNCNGLIDENLTQACGSDVGVCHSGAETCTAGVWSACIGSVGPTPEICDHLDNDCNGLVDDGQVCERQEAAFGAGAEGGSSDVDGDGRADACARTPNGFACLLASGHGFSGTMVGPPLADADGFADPFRAATLRMGDLDGDGRADLCAVGSATIECWHLGRSGSSERLLTLPLPTGTTNLLLADVDGDRRDDVCVRASDGLRCNLSSAAGFERQIRLDALSDANGIADVLRYGTLRMGDIDGDHRADVCVRAQEGVRCWRAEGTGFGGELVGPPWSDAAGFTTVPYWSTLRLADVDGDGRADVCARMPADDTFACAIANGHGFDVERRGPTLAASAGWGDPAQYSTLHLGDVDGDGDLDLCGRASDGVHCWLWSGNDFGTQIVGPPLSDTAGWHADAYYRSVRLADVTGDGRADVCARGPGGLHCYESDGEGFPREWATGQWTDAQGANDPAGVASVRIAGGSASRTTGCTCGAAGSVPRAGMPWLAAGVVALVVARRRKRVRRGC